MFRIPRVLILLLLAASASLMELLVVLPVPFRKEKTHNSRRIQARARDCSFESAAKIAGVKSWYCDSLLLPTCDE